MCNTSNVLLAHSLHSQQSLNTEQIIKASKPLVFCISYGLSIPHWHISVIWLISNYTAWSERWRSLAKVYSLCHCNNVNNHVCKSLTCGWTAAMHSTICLFQCWIQPLWPVEPTAGYNRQLQQKTTTHNSNNTAFTQLNNHFHHQHYPISWPIMTSLSHGLWNIC